MPVHVRIHQHEVERLFSPAGPVWSEVEQTVNRGVAISRSMCPVDDGTLRQSIEGRVERRRHQLVGSWGSKLHYALFRHQGTGLFGPRRAMIRPKHGRWLVFEPSGLRPGPVRKGGRGRAAKGRRGGVVFARAVRGQPGSPFLTAALQLVAPGVPIRWHVQH